MHIPKRHMVDKAEEAMEEAGYKPMRPELGIKIVINAGGPPSHRPMPMKKMMKKKMKAKRIGGSGPMEDALSAAY